MIVVAHAGHWLVSLLYVAPVVALVAGLVWQALRDRRAGGWEERDDADEDV